MPRSTSHPKKPRAKHHDDAAPVARDVQASLQSIYNDDAQEDLSVFQQGSRWRHVAWVVAAIVLLGVMSASAWWGWVVFQDARQAAGAELDVAWAQGIERVAIGEERSFEVAWRNTSGQVLRDAEVRIQLPTDFTMTSVSPEPSDASLHAWRLGVVAPGEKGVIRIKGFFLGSVGGSTSLQALGIAARSDGAVGQDSDALTLQYDGSVLAGTFTVPERIQAGESFDVKYVLGNLGRETMRAMQLRVVFPSGFLPAVSSTAAYSVDSAERTVMVPVAELKPGEYASLTFSGAFASGFDGEGEFSAAAGTVGVDGGFLPAAQSVSRTAVRAGDLVLQLVANGSAEDVSIVPGATLRTSLRYENTSSETLKHAQITLFAESYLNGTSATGTSLLQWKRLDESRGAVSSTKSRVQTLVYRESNVSSLAELAPHASDTFDIAWPTLKTASGTKDALIRLSAEALIENADGSKRIVRAQPITVAYKTDATLQTSVRYFTEEGAPIGSGPLPPVIGQATTYRVYWSVKKTLHALDQAIVEAMLPSNVQWTGSTESSQGAFRYDAQTRTVRWELGRVDEQRGSVDGWFMVTLVPGTLDVGRFAGLVGEASLRAKDAKRNEFIEQKAASLSTDLRDDEGAVNKGVVRSP